MRTVRLGAGSGYWGAELEAPVRLAREGRIQYLCFDLLAELTMSLLERMRLKDAKKGYIPDLLRQARVILPFIRANGVKMVSNGGGTNCGQAMEEVIAIAKADGYAGLKIATVEGDNVTDKIDGLLAKGWTFANLDTGEEDIGRIRNAIVSAHAYLGADGIIEALEKGAELVITGRVSDNALYVGPLMHELGWRFEPAFVDRIAAAVATGHVIECAELCCGAMSNLWDVVPEPWRVGFPIAEVSEDGSATIEKLEDTGGLINSWTIKEHLVYEVHDPRRYLMPDGVADLTTIKLDDLGQDRVRISGCKGAPRPAALKVQVGYRDGFIAEGLYIQAGPRILEKTEALKHLFSKLVERTGIKPRDIRFDRIGLDSLSGVMYADPPEDSVRELGLRIAVRTETQAEAQALRAEMMRLTVYGPVGVAWNAPPPVRPVISLWPTLIPRDAVETKVAIAEVA
jgi:hypothetical protein